ncbi:MAG: CoA transferase [Chloroflexi bacterium]|nr:CoA transferase [Chloroflexota bacterium]
MEKESWSKGEYYAYAKSLFDPEKIWEKPEALQGLLVLEFATFMNGPLVASLLGEMGAEVIKFELPFGAREDMPTGGDPVRFVGPPGTAIQGTNLQTFVVNRNKHHVTLDIAHPKGKEIFRKFALQADVIVENLRAGTMDRMGLGYRQLSQENPRLIYLATNGPGQWGPLADMVSYDILGQAMSGFIYSTGFPEDDPQYPGIPTMVGNGIGDSVGAMWGYIGLLTALYYREKTGKGQFIEFSQPEGLLRILDMTLELYSTAGQIRERTGNRYFCAAPYYVSRCKDGYVAIAAATDKLFRNLCGAMGQPELADDPRFKSNLDRTAHQDDLYAIIDRWLLKHTREELREIGDRCSFVCGPVMNAKEICEFPHYWERGAVREVEDPYYGRMKVATMPPHFSETPARIKTLSKPLGADNEHIYGKYLGLTRKELEALREERVI